MKSILFDVDDTLYDQLEPFREACKQHFHFEQLSIESLYTLSRKYSDEIFLLSENGKMSMEDMQIYRIQNAMKKLGYTITDEQALDFQKTYAKNQNEIELLPYMQIVFEYCIAHKIKIGIITNGPSKHQRKKIKQLGLYKWFKNDNIFISSEVGIAKPDSGIFRFVEEKMQLDNHQTYYVGDSFENDIIGAKQAGWKAVWCNYRNHIKDITNYKPEFIVDDSFALMVILKNIILQSNLE